MSCQRIIVVFIAILAIVLGCAADTTTDDVISTTQAPTTVTTSPTTTTQHTPTTIPQTSLTTSHMPPTTINTTESTTAPITLHPATTLVTTIPATTFVTTVPVISTSASTQTTTTITALPDSIPIASAAELVAFITSGNPSGNYHLTEDIDLQGVTLTGSSLLYSGTFDGLGHTISNAVINASGNKMGFLFKQLSHGGTIRNVHFQECVQYGGGNGEASAFVSAYAQGGATFSHLTFRNVSVIHTGSYAALIFGDVTADSLDPDDKIIIENITFINDENNKIQGGDYIGGLVGGARKYVKIEMRNIYVQSEIRSTGVQTTGILMGRDNSANVELTVDNVVIKGSLHSAKDTGVILGRSSQDTIVNASNVYLSDLVVNSGNAAVNIAIGNAGSGGVKHLSDVYYNASTTVFNVSGNPVSVTDGTALAESVITADWFDGSDFDKEFFKHEGASIFRNIESTGPIVVTGISVITAQVKSDYLVGEALDLAQLKVYVMYSDSSSELLDSSLYSIQSSAFNNQVTGTYDIIVSYGEWEKSFSVHVIEVTDFIVDSLLFKDTYLVGQSLNYDNLVVKALLSDGTYLRLNSTDYSLDSSAYNAQNPGTYALVFTYQDFSDIEIDVFVVSNTPIISENKIVLIVDGNYTGMIGEAIENAHRFTTIKQAFQHLANLSLSTSVEKIVYVKAGTYYEKVVLTVPNVSLIGDGREHTIITYDAASGLESPTGSNWGTQGSATVAIKSSAKNFMAAHITFANGFDYLHATIGDKQAVALVNEADQAIYYHCGFLGYQDTLYAKSGRQYYINVYIEGVVDFIFGNGGPAFFEDSVIKMLYRPTSGGALATNKGFATQESALLDYGYVFYRNQLIAEAGVQDNSVFLGRPWGPNAHIAYIENVFGNHMSSIGWTDMRGNLPEN
ncbi:MAG: pectinesterase family protein, partial [Candidatus Izemoplasmatales bacterium]